MWTVLAGPENNSHGGSAFTGSLLCGSGGTCALPICLGRGPDVTQTMTNPDCFPESRGEPVPSPAELRALYDQDGQFESRLAARQGMWGSSIIYLLFSIPDLLLVPDVAPYTIAVRVVLWIFIVSTIETQFRTGAGTAWLNATCAFALISGYSVWLVAAIQTDYTLNFSYYMIFGAIFMMGANLFFSFKFRLSVAASGIILSIFFVALYFFPATPAYQFAFGTLLHLVLCLHLLCELEAQQGALQRLPQCARGKDAAEGSGGAGQGAAQAVAHRSADRPGKPARRRREAARLLERLAAVRQQFRRHPHRRRFLQEVQRLLRPSGRRPLPRARRQCARCHDQAAQCVDRPLWRRRIHRAGAHGAPGAGRAAGRSHPADRRESRHPARAAPRRHVDRDGEHRRGVHQNADWGETRKDHPRGGPRALSRQGERPQLRQAVRPQRSAKQRRKRKHRRPAEDRDQPGPRLARLSADPEHRSGPARSGRGADAAAHAGWYFRAAQPLHSRWRSGPAPYWNSAAGRSERSATS